MPGDGRVAVAKREYQQHLPFATIRRTWVQCGSDKRRLPYNIVLRGAEPSETNQQHSILSTVSGTKGRRFESSQARHLNQLIQMGCRGRFLGFLQFRSVWVQNQIRELLFCPPLRLRYRVRVDRECRFDVGVAENRLRDLDGSPSSLSIVACV